MNIYEIRRLNLIHIIKTQFKGNAAAFGRFVGRSGNYINRLEWEKTQKGSKSLGEDLALEFCQALGRPKNWLDEPRWLNNNNDDVVLTVNDAVTINEKIKPYNNAQYSLDLAEFSGIPVRGNAQLGDNGHWTEIDHPPGFGEGIIKFPTRDRTAYAVRCTGDSMLPRIRNGEFVIVEPNTPPKPGEEVLVSSTDGRVMVKIFLYETDEEIGLISINDAHPRQTILKSDIQAMHYVAAICKKPLFEPLP